MIFIDEPKPAILSDYHTALAMMVETVKTLPGILAIYQIGGFGAPGISDIDMVAVFEDGVSNLEDPQIGLTGIPRYLFAHQLFGTSKTLFHESRKFTAFHNYRLLWGAELRPDDEVRETDIAMMMHRQLALEYLVRMWINMIIEKKYGIFKVRNLLLHGNGLTYDLEFLRTTPQSLVECLNTIMQWRADWYVKRPSDKDIKNLYINLLDKLEMFLTEYLLDNTLYLPKLETYKIGRHIILNPSDRFAVKFSGLKTPWVPKKYARKALSLQSRMSRLNLDIPFQSEGTPPFIQESFHYSSRARAYGRLHLPFYMPLTSSLVLNT